MTMREDAMGSETRGESLSKYNLTSIEMEVFDWLRKKLGYDSRLGYDAVIELVNKDDESFAQELEKHIKEHDIRPETVEIIRSIRGKIHKEPTEKAPEQPAAARETEPPIRLTGKKTGKHWDKILRPKGEAQPAPAGKGDKEIYTIIRKLLEDIGYGGTKKDDYSDIRLDREMLDFTEEWLSKKEQEQQGDTTGHDLVAIDDEETFRAGWQKYMKERGGHQAAAVMVLREARKRAEETPAKPEVRFSNEQIADGKALIGENDEEAFRAGLEAYKNKYGAMDAAAIQRLWQREQELIQARQAAAGGKEPEPNLVSKENFQKMFEGMAAVKAAQTPPDQPPTPETAKKDKVEISAGPTVEEIKSFWGTLTPTEKNRVHQYNEKQFGDWIGNVRRFDTEKARMIIEIRKLFATNSPLLVETGILEELEQAPTIDGVEVQTKTVGGNEVKFIPSGYLTWDQGLREFQAKFKKVRYPSEKEALAILPEIKNRLREAAMYIDEKDSWVFVNKKGKPGNKRTGQVPPDTDMFVGMIVTEQETASHE